MRRFKYWLGGIAVVAAMFVIVWTIAANTNASQDTTTERARNTLNSCLDSNRRNTSTKQVVRDEFPKTVDTRVVFLLIDALAPYRENCQAYVKARVSAD
jgi:hypothetical protein